MITLMNGLDRGRFSSSIVAALEGGPLQSLIATDISHQIIGAGGFLKSLPALYFFIRKQRPHIVISSMAPMNFTVLLLRPFFPHVKFIVREATLPSYILSVYPRLKPIMHYAYTHLYAKASVVIAPSRVVLEELALLGINRNHIHLLYNPVQEMNAEFSAKPNIPAERILFVASGRFNKQKGFDRLIDILPRVKSDWHLLILGEGEERATIEKLVTHHGLSDRVTLMGHQNDPWRFYKAADCLLLPSRVEGLPNVVLESLACGTPVIAIKEAGGAVDIAAHAPDSVFIADTMNDFAVAMGRIMQKTESNSLLPGVFSQSRVMAQFTGLLEDVVTNVH